jgi:hypothetical protein
LGCVAERVWVEGLNIMSRASVSSNALLFETIYLHKCHNDPSHVVSTSNSKSQSLVSLLCLMRLPPLRWTQSPSMHGIYMRLLHSSGPHAMHTPRCAPEEAIFPIIVRSYGTNSGVDYFRVRSAFRRNYSHANNHLFHFTTVVAQSLSPPRHPTHPQL